MRDLLTILAAALIVVLTTALVAPYFIDWSSHRTLIEQRLSKAAGTNVEIAGPIVVRLLPQPVFKLARVTVGGTEPGTPSFTAEEVDVSIALTALMRGDLQIAEATLLRPRIDLGTIAGSGVPLGHPAVSTPERFQFQHVAVVDGTLTVSTTDRGSLTLTGIALDAQATSLAGPFTATGGFGAIDDRRPFRLSTGAFDNDRMRIKLVLEGGGSRPALDLDGTLSATRPAGESPRLSFDGRAVLAGELPLENAPSTVPWRLSGHVASDGPRATIDDLALQAGRDLRALDATGAGSVSLDGEPTVKLRLHAPQLDIDALAVAPEKSTLPPPRGLDLLRRLNAGSGSDLAEALSALPFRFAADIALDTASAGPQTLVGLAGHIDAERGKPVGLRFAAKGPSDASLAFDGRVETDPVPVFRGRLDAAVRDLPRLTKWLAPALPEAETWARRTIPARSLSFGGTVDLSSTGLAARDVALTLDRTTARGTLSYTAPSATEPGRIFADLGTDALNLDTLPDLKDSPVDWGALDLDLTLKAHAVSLASSTLGIGDAGDLALRLIKTGADIRLESLSAVLGDARLAATGTVDAAAAHLDAEVDAPKLDALAAGLAKLLPGSLTDLLQARSAALSPAKLSLNLSASRGGSGELLPTALSMNGTLAGSRIQATLKPDRPGDLDPATSPLSASLTAEADDGPVLMRQLGLPLSGAASTIGPGRFEASASGSAAAGFDASATLALAGVTAVYRGRAKPELGNGHLSVAGADLSPLLRATGLAQPRDGDPWPVAAQADLAWHDSTVSLHHLGGRWHATDFGGDLTLDLATPAPGQPSSPRPVLFGVLSVNRLAASSLLDLALGAPGSSAPEGAWWSTEPFGPVVLRLPRSQVNIKVATLDVFDRLAVGSASLTLKSERGALTLADLTGRLGDGRIGATVTLRRDGPTATLDGSLTLTGVTLAGGGPTGKIAASLDGVGVGTSPATLVASMAGSGRVKLTGGRLPETDPAAVAQVAVTAERNTSEVDADTIAKTLAAELARAPLGVGDVDGAATLAAGVLQVGPFHAESGGAGTDLDAALDLRTMTLTSKAVIRPLQPLPDWKGSPPEVTVTLAGPLGGTTSRALDAAGFVNALQARAIARDQERIDVMQQDIRERAFFNRRLKVIEAEQAAERERIRAAAEIERQLKLSEPPAPALPSATVRAPIEPPSPPLPPQRTVAPTEPPSPPLRPSRLSPGGRGKAAPTPSASKPAAPILPPMTNVPDPTAAGRY